MAQGLSWERQLDTVSFRVGKMLFSWLQYAKI